jgi:hypothetical protein
LTKPYICGKIKQKRMKNKKTHIDIWIDEMVPCLCVAETGEEKETVAYRVYQKDLKGYNKRTGWYTNWHTMPFDVEVYALAVKDEQGIQGLLAIKDDKDADAALLCWGCTAPCNNKLLTDSPKYIGVGGHLFAIAADLSVKWGHGGAMYGQASNSKLVRHYVEKFNAMRIRGAESRYFMIDEDEAGKIMEEYDYEWR